MALEKHTQVANINGRLAWFYGVGAAIVFGINHFSPYALPEKFKYAVLLLFPVLCIFHAVVSKAARKFQHWARTASLGIGVLYLFAVPIGTVLGIYLIMICRHPWPNPKAYVRQARGDWHQDGRRR